MWTSVSTLCFRIWPVRRGNANGPGAMALLLEARGSPRGSVKVLIVVCRFSDSHGWTRFSILSCGCLTRFSDFKIEIWALYVSTRFGARELRCGLRSLDMHCRAVDGAALMRLRLASAGGPLRARPLLHSLSAQVTKGSISLGQSETEIGNFTRVEL